MGSPPGNTHREDGGAWEHPGCPEMANHSGQWGLGFEVDKQVIWLDM